MAKLMLVFHNQCKSWCAVSVFWPSMWVWHSDSPRSSYLFA